MATDEGFGDDEKTQIDNIGEVVPVKGKTKLGDLSWQKQTGWDKSTDKLNFGDEGLVGHCWKQLDVITDFGGKVSLHGVKCDYNQNSVVIMFSDDGSNWHKYEMIGIEFTHDKTEHIFDKPIQSRYGRMLWAKTDGVNGIHAQFLSIKTTSVKGKTKVGELSFEMTTGWAKSTDKLNFDEEGLVGHNWKQLDVVTDFGHAIPIIGVKCDYSKNPVVIMFSDDGSNWNKYEMITIEFTDNKPEQMFDAPIKVRFGRMFWATTINGGKGFHAQFLSN